MESLVYNGYEVEVGSPLYERLVGQKLIVPVAGAEDAKSPSHALGQLSLEDLKDRAEKLGIEGASSLRNKKAVIVAIEGHQGGTNDVEMLDD